MRALSFYSDAVIEVVTPHRRNTRRHKILYRCNRGIAILKTALRRGRFV